MTFDSTLAEQSQVTQCPSCNMAFLVSDEQLLVANGQVRCGSCLTIFQADQYWLTAPDAAEQDALASAHPPGNKPNTSMATASEHTPQSNSAPQPDITPPPDSDFELSDSFLSLNQPETASHSFEAYSPDDDDIVPNEEQWAKALLAEEEEPLEKKAPRNDILSAILDQASDEENSAAPTNPAVAMTQDHGNNEDLAPAELESAEKWMQQVLGRQEQDEEPAGEPGDAAPAASLLAEEPTEEYVPEIFRKTTASSVPSPPETAIAQPTLLSALLASRAVRYCRSLSYATWQWLGRISNMVAIGIALLILLLQVIWSHSDQLYQQPALRPLLIGFCQLSGCILPRQEQPASIVQHHAIVYRAAHQPDVITLTTELHNISASASGYPLLRAELTDAQGQIVAAAIFEPSEYLPSQQATRASAIDQSTSGQPQLPSGQTLPLSLQLVDPGAHAVNYRLRLLTAED